MIDLGRTDIETLLANERIGRLAMADAAGRPYVIPLPFCWLAGALYLRLPVRGRKDAILRQNDQVCFEIDTYAADLSQYASVLIEGRLVAVEDLAEKGRVRAANEEKYRRLRGPGRTGHGRQTPLENVPLRKIVVTTLSGRKKGRADA